MCLRQPIFDAFARADGLSEADLENLLFFGVRALVTSAHDGVIGASVEGLEAHFDELVHDTVSRARRVGISAHAAVGVPAARVPWHGLEALMASLPGWLTLPEVVAISGVGLHEGGEREEAVLRRQCEIAGEVRVPLVVTVPARERERRLRRTLAILRESGLPGERVLVTGVREPDVTFVRACGYSATLGSIDAEAAADLVARKGAEGLLISSDIGEGSSDPLPPARLIAAMEGKGLSRAVVRRVAFDNASAFYGVGRHRRQGQTE